MFILKDTPLIIELSILLGKIINSLSVFVHHIKIFLRKDINKWIIKEQSLKP
ncbi:MAG: hypothetical protein PWP31_190 [Clostridia bacterium]|nr:hypothetical protein [Clostridia bacterium]